MWKTILKSMDFYSPEIKLNIGKNRTSYRNLFSGFLGFISLGIIFGWMAYFMIQFIQGHNYNIITNIEPSRNIKLEYHNFPIMFRLTDATNKILNDSDRLVGFRSLYWWLNGSVQMSKEIKMEKCDLNKHFGEYSYLFINTSEIDSFYCLVPRPSNYSVDGIYGDKYKYSFYNIYIHFCTNDTNKDDCYDISTIHSVLSNPYIEVRSLDYTMNNFMDLPGSLFVRYDRHPISSSSFKRIWMFLRSYNYSTDDGYITKTIKSQNFFMVESFRYDTDLRDLQTGSFIPYSFCTYTILNYSQVNNIFRSFKKIQNLVADTGGIIKGVMTIFFLLNYTVSHNILSEKLVNSTCSLFLDEEEAKNFSKRNSIFIEQTPKKERTLLNFATVNEVPNVTFSEMKLSKEEMRNAKSFDYNELDVCSNHHSISKDKSSSSVYLDKKLTKANLKTAKKNKQKKVKLNLYHYLLPFVCFKNNQMVKNLTKKMKIVHEKMNVIYMINKFNDIEKLIDLLFSNEQKLLFSLIPWKIFDSQNVPSDYEIDRCYNFINMKRNKTEIDYKLIKMLLEFNG